jgi:2'-5' RNA ligase
MPGKRLRADQLHITLAFLGNVDEVMAQCAREAAQQANAAPFSLKLDRLGFFARPRVVWLAPATVPAPLQALYQRLNQNLASQCQFEPDRRPFRPHMTLIRKCRKPPPREALAPVDWPVADFALVASETLPEGARYRVLTRWPLTAPAGED